MHPKVSTYASHAARIVLGLLFFVFGLNGFLGFLPAPPPSGPAGAFAGALAATGYMFPLLKGVEVVAGALLLSNRFVPLALVLLAPIVVNIAMFHIVLQPGALMVVSTVGLELFLAWSYRASYRPLFVATAKLQAGGAEESPRQQPAAAAI